MEEKLNNLRGGVNLVKPEDRKSVEEMYSDRINQWRRRKRIFKDLWDAITENSPKDLKEFKVTHIVNDLYKLTLSFVGSFFLQPLIFDRRNLELNMMKMLV